MSFFSKIFGDANARQVKSMQSVVEKINQLENQFESFSREELISKTQEFKNRLAVGASLDDLLPEAFAAVREASKRTLDKRHFDVQLLGGMVLHSGKIAEMKTGEGKTLVATLPVYLNALTGKGVHVVTVNDYLSRRDTVWMGQIYDALGLTVACLNHESSYIYDTAHINSNLEEAKDAERDTTGSFKVVHEFLRPVSRRDAYGADITYGTNNEFGFDYLRDNMVYEPIQKVQAKGHAYAIVDEVDSILIDEARTPLIISAPEADSGDLYQKFAKIVPQLVENEDYNVDEKLRAVSINEAGIEKVEKMLGVQNMYEEGGTRFVHHLEQALKAQVLHHKDKEYVVKDGEVIIVDEFTGRLMPGRRWSSGLHQAVEAKEGVHVQKESRTFATITFQNYFRLYQKLAGMTGTAQTSAEEFHKVYKLEVVTIPTHRPLGRQDLPDRIYKTESGKFKSVAQEIKLLHEKGQPVLVGTVSIDKNELLATYLKHAGVPHNVLNAKNHEQEAQIIAQAGRKGAVTVATNLAGRGVDILLGGNPPILREVEEVRSLGGLHVIGTERHEARRIDNQLRGRAGRQGDPGSSQFFVSTEDEVARIFGGDRLKNVMETLGVGEDDMIENRFISRAIEQAQAKIEGHNFDTRKYVLEYDDVMNRHRTAIYTLRDEVLNSEDNSHKIKRYIKEAIGKIVAYHTSYEDSQWNSEEIAEGIKAIIPMEGLHTRILDFSDKGDKQGLHDFLDKLVEDVCRQREEQLGTEVMRDLERAVLLRVIDELWVDHLEQMDDLRESVRLRAYGQRDPLVEYKIEGQKMFNDLQDAIGSQAAGIFFKVGPVSKDRQTQKVQLQTNMDNQQNRSSHNQAQSDNIGRNDPCPCGAINPETGKPYKYKKCGLINAPYHKKS